MSNQPWTSGPREILEHGLSLMLKDSDVNRRLAMISIDNSVELMIKTFLGLPKRITGIKMSRKDFDSISESFPSLLDAIEQYAADKLEGIDLGEIEWFHRLRNQLYHQGNGLTVERTKVEIYAELAKLLFENLFGVKITNVAYRTKDLLGVFMESWVEFEKAAVTYIERRPLLGQSRKTPPLEAISSMIEEGYLDQDKYNEIMRLRDIRNKVVHGVGDYRTILNQEVITDIKNFTQFMKTHS